MAAADRATTLRRICVGKRSEAERATGIAFDQPDEDLAPVAVDGDTEPVAAAILQAHGARELIRLDRAKPGGGCPGAVGILGVVARVGAEGANVRLHLLARGFLLRVL